MTHDDDRRTRHTLWAAAALASVLTLAACGSGSGSTGAGGPVSSVTGQSTGSGAGQGSGRLGAQGGRGFPGVSGLVADVSGSTAQVQSATAQTAVTWTKSTAFTTQVKTTASTLRVGDCVSARPARAAGSGSGITGTPAPTPTASASDSTVAAQTVEIFPATGGSCAANLGGGLGFGGGAFGNRTGAARPTQTGGLSSTGPGGPPQGGPNGFGGQARGAVGTVTALGDGTFTVAPVARRDAASANTATKAPVTVTYAASTTFTTLTKAAASSVKVGVCVTAIGKTDDTGAVTASTLQVSQPVDGSCTSGFRGAGGFGRPGATTTGTGNA